MTRRRGKILLAVAAVVILVAVIARKDVDAGLPRYEGRSARWWLRELCRQESGRGGGRSEAGSIEARMAFLEMGTNAVPFLVEEAFASRSDSQLRSNLHDLFLRFPGWAGRGAFVPHRTMVEQSAFLLRALRPPTSTMLPLIEPRLRSTNHQERGQALFLLGTVGDGAVAVVPWLASALTNSIDPTWPMLAAQSVRWLGREASNALPSVLSVMKSPRPGMEWSVVSWLSALGPAAAPAVPLLESLTTTTNPTLRLSAAVALTYVQPGHTRALEMLNEAASDANRDVVRDPGRDSPRQALMYALFHSARGPNEVLAGFIEPFAGAEAAAWSPRGASYQACLALERTAPARAAAVYKSAIEGAGAIHAAGNLLRIERTSELAARTLAGAGMLENSASVQALWFLGEASSSNRVAMLALEKVAAAGNPGGPSRTAAQAFARSAVDAARGALARIRYRDAREACGLPANEWW